MSPRGTELGAVDAEDLQIVSARLQDAVAQVKDLVYLRKEQRFAGLFNRFMWEKAGGKSGDARVRSGLHFNHVRSVQAHNLRRENPEAVVALLAIRFTPSKSEDGGAEDPGGVVELLFAGGGALKLDVECIEAGLSDIGGAWTARGRPAHGV